MTPNDLSAYRTPLRADVRMLSDAGLLSEAHDLISYLVSHDKVDALEKERLLLEDHVISLKSRDFPYDEAEALSLCKEAGVEADAGSLKQWRLEGRIPYALVDGRIHYHKRFLDTLCKDKPSPQKEADLELRRKVITKVTGWGHAEGKIRVHVGVKVAPDAWRKGQLLSVELPVPVATPFTQDVSIIAQSGQLVSITPKLKRRRVALMRGVARPDEEFWIEYALTNRIVYHDMTSLEQKVPEKLYHSKDELPYLDSNPYIAELAAAIAGGERNPVRLARAAYQYVIGHVDYAYMPSYQTIENLAVYGATMRRGDCGIQAVLFINLLRAMGIKANWMGGMYVTPSSVSNHDWATFQLPGSDETFYADCSFGGSALRRGDTVSSGYYFGNLDVMRIGCTTILAPGAKSMQDGHWRNDPTDNQKAEAWYEDRPLLSEELIDTRGCLDFRLQ